MRGRGEASSHFNSILRSLRRLSYMPRTDHSTYWMHELLTCQEYQCHLPVDGLIYLTESSCRFRAFRSIRWLIDGATWIDNTRKPESGFERNGCSRCRISRSVWITYLFPCHTYGRLFRRRFPLPSRPTTPPVISIYEDIRRAMLAITKGPAI